MEESIILLSSLSPKINTKARKPKKQGKWSNCYAFDNVLTTNIVVHTKLALKKQIRRSSVFDKLPESSPANVVECNSSESLPSSSSSSEVVDKRSSVIVISDTSSESDAEYGKVEIKGKTCEKSVVIAKEAKNDAIQNWICSVNEATKKVSFEVSVFSELSTIYDENDVKRNECETEKKTSYNSTFVSDVKNPNFDEQFRKIVSKYASAEESSETVKSESSGDDSVIEDSFSDDKVEDNFGKKSGEEKCFENHGKVDESNEKPQDFENSFGGEIFYLFENFL